MKNNFETIFGGYVPPEIKIVLLQSARSVLTSSTLSEGGNIPTLTDDEATW